MFLLPLLSIKKKIKKKFLLGQKRHQEPEIAAKSAANGHSSSSVTYVSQMWCHTLKVHPERRTFRFVCVCVCRFLLCELISALLFTCPPFTSFTTHAGSSCAAFIVGALLCSFSSSVHHWPAAVPLASANMLLSFSAPLLYNYI